MIRELNHPFILFARFIVLLAFALGVLGASVSAAGTDIIWTNGAAGNNSQWGTIANWSPNTVPNGTTYNAVFTNRTSGGTNAFTINGTNYALTGVTPANSSYSFGQLNFADKPSGNDGWNLYCNPGTASVLTVNGNGGTNPVIVSGSGCTAALITAQSLRVALGLSGANEIQVNGAVLQIQANLINGVGLSAGLNKTGTGTLILSGTNTYTGNTTISAGTLQLAGGSINTSPMISIAAGATFDVSGIAPYTLGGSTTLSASGTGTTPGVTAAEIKGKAGTLVALGTRPISLTYDGSHPALYVSRGTLSLGENVFTVNSAVPLVAGTYTLVQQASGNIIIFGNPSVNGTAIGPGTVGVISVSGGNVLLKVISAATIGVETASDGSGTVVPAQSLVAGNSLTVYAIARTADGSFLANVAANWSLTTLAGGVASGDLIPAGDSKSATLTGHVVGTAIIRLAWGELTSATPMAPIVSAAQMTGPASFALTGSGSSNETYKVFASTNLTAPIGSWWLVGSTNATTQGLINFLDLQATNNRQFYRLAAPLATDSGSLTVVPGAATQVRVETAADGSGTLVPTQTFVSGYAITTYAVTRDAWGNCLANAAADAWTTANVTGGVTNSDLSPSSGSNSIFTGHAVGTGQIRASLGGLTAVNSGLLTVVPSATLLWSATPANYQWDTMSTNWVGGPGVFTTGDPVLFTDSGSASSPIELVGTLNPASVTVDVSTHDYIFGGSGKLSGSGVLVKSGSRTLTLANTTPNNYTGGTFVNGGTLAVSPVTSFSLANPSPITIAGGATLLMNGSGVITWSNEVTGTGLWQVGTGTGSQTTTLAGDYSAFNGTLEVAAGNGKVSLPTPAKYLSASATIQLASGLTLYLPGAGTLVSGIQMYGGTTGEALGQLRFGGTSGGTVSGPVTLFANTTIGVDSGKAATISGNIGGSSGFTKLSAGTLTLSGVSTYAGGTSVNAGTLMVNGLLGSGASTVTVTGGAGVLGGRGTILSRVQVLSDGALAPGASGVGTLTISNDLTLAGKTIMEVNMAAGSNDMVVATGGVTFGGTLIVSNLAKAFYMGDSFTLFQGGSYAGSFAAISPATPGSGLAWDLSSLAVDGTLLVTGSSVTNDSLSYGGYDIKVSSRFNAYNSLVNRAYPLYDYSVNVLKIGSAYMAVTGDRYSGSGEDGDHIFGWTSPAGQPNTWTNMEGSSSSAPLFLKSNSFGANTMDPELIYNPSNSTWYLYVQKQISSGDRIMALTSTNLKNWTAHTSGPVIINTPTNQLFFHHEEVIYVPWSSTPFWLYVYLQVDGVNKGYKLIKSNDPLAFDYTQLMNSSGESNLGGQRGYLQEATNGPLFIRINETAVNGKNVPILQFSADGSSWSGSSGRVVLAGSSDTGRYGNCYFPGISTINGNGALEYMGHNRWRAVYAAACSASPTAPDIFYSEIGCGEIIIDLN